MAISVAAPTAGQLGGKEREREGEREGEREREKERERETEWRGKFQRGDLRLLLSPVQLRTLKPGNPVKKEGSLHVFKAVVSTSVSICYLMGDPGFN